MTFQEFEKCHQNASLFRIDNLPRTLKMILFSAQTGDDLIPGDIEPKKCAWMAMLFRQFQQLLVINGIMPPCGKAGWWPWHDNFIHKEFAQ